MNEVSEAEIECHVKVYAPEEDRGTPTDTFPDPPDDDAYSIYVRGPMTQHHLRFPATFRWMWSRCAEMDLLALAVVSHATPGGGASFAALYGHGGHFYMLKRGANDDSTTGRAWENRIEDFVEEYDVLWLDESIEELDDLVNGEDESEGSDDG